MPVEVQFDKPRTLQFDVPSYRALESAMGGKPMGQVIGHLSQVSVNAIAASLWAGFKHEDAALSERDVVNAFDDYLERGGKIGVVAKALGEAFEQSGLLRDEKEPDESAVDVGSIELDRQRRVKFGMKAVRMLEEAMGGMGIAGIYEHVGTLGVNALVMALWLGLKSEDKDITPNLTVKLLDRYLQNGGSLRTVAVVVRKAIEATGIFKNDEALVDDEEREGNGKAA